MERSGDGARRRPGWIVGLGATALVAWLGLLTLGAVIVSTWFVVRYARMGPIPGQKVLRPVNDLGGLSGETPLHAAPGH